MLRRIHVARVQTGEIPIDPAQARHARDVLRLESGRAVEVFDDAGNLARGELILSGREAVVRVTSVEVPSVLTSGIEWTIAAAVPKGERADWMVEKLSELGTAEFLPLAAARSVVLPEGRNKRERWARIATESAKQSRRTGVMRIGELKRVDDVLATLAGSPHGAGWYLSTAPDARPAGEAAAGLAGIAFVTALVGPEGGWTGDELARFAAAGLTPVRLTPTVLRVETAAVAAAALIGSLTPPYPCHV